MIEGTRVVIQPSGRAGKWEPPEFTDRRGTFIQIASTHGYARVKLDAPLFPGGPEIVLVHPESLVEEGL